MSVGAYESTLFSRCTTRTDAFRRFALWVVIAARVLEIAHGVVHGMVARYQTRLALAQRLVPADRARFEPRLDVLLGEPLEPHRQRALLGEVEHQPPQLHRPHFAERGNVG